MKKLFIALLVLAAFSPAKAQADFNYTFYPAPIYGRYSETFKPDTTAEKVSVVRDSSTQQVNTIIRKEGDHITISTLANISQNLYSAQVNFIGFLGDGKNSLLYQAQTPTQETIVVNPQAGYAVVIFKQCSAQPWEELQRCNWINHYFGNIALKSYKP